MKWREVRVVAGKELRETLRDRRTLAVMVLFPLVVYPLVSLVTAQVLSARVARLDAHVSRVAVEGPVALVATVRGRLAAPEIALAPAATVADVAANRVDAVVEVTRGAGQAPLLRILYDETREDSARAEERVARAMAATTSAACPPAFSVVSQSISPRAHVSSYLLSKIIPLVVVVMVMLGAFHPAIDITAGERERGTLETTLSAPIDRASLMAGKVVAVATLAALTGLLNLASMSLTVIEGARLTASGAADLSIPWLRAAAAFAVVLPTAFLFAAVMVAIGALARSFKEAQTLLTPVYVLCLAPSMTAALGDFRLEGVAAWIPGVGVTLLARDLIVGRASLATSIAVVASTIGYGLAALALAARLYDSERLFFSDEPGLGLGAWIRHVLHGEAAANDDANDDDQAVRRSPRPGEAPSAGQALALYAIACLLLFFVFIPLQRWRLGPGLAISEWGGLLGLTWIHARGNGQTLAAALRLKRPTARALAGAGLIGLSAWLVVGLVADWILPAPKEVVESLRRMIAPGQGEGDADRGLLATLFLVALTPAICEEALFRGPILRGLRSRFSPVGTAILTGLLFGIYHLDAWRLLPTALLGVVLSAIALSADSIVPAMLAHFVNNAALITLARSASGDPADLPRATKLAVWGGALVVLAVGARLVRSPGTTPRVM